MIAIVQVQIIFGKKFSTFACLQVVPCEWMIVNLPFKSFKAYFRGRPVPDAEPLDTSYISSLGIQIVGGVYQQQKQKGTSSLEMDFIQAV